MSILTKMAKIKDWFAGKKTYTIAIIILILSVSNGFDLFETPEYVWAVLAALGLGSIRIAVLSIERAIKETGE